MAKKSIELFMLPVENDKQKKEIYDVIDNKHLEDVVYKSVLMLEDHLETAKEKFYVSRSHRQFGPDLYREKLVLLINEAVNSWKDEFGRLSMHFATLDSDEVFEVKVIGDTTFTFEYSSGIQRAFAKDKTLYQLAQRAFNGNEDIVKAISLANEILLRKSNFPINRFKD
jgi:hypothetical protein